MGNPIVHFEIAGPEGLSLQQFYRDLFGWDVLTQGEEMGYYGLVQWNEGGIGGGIFQSSEDMPFRNYVTVYIQVDDLQAALDKASGLGANTILPPMEIAPDSGSIAMFTDPAGNFMGLHLPPTEMADQIPPKGNAPPVVHFEVGGSDAEALAEFYIQMFDWQINFLEENNYRLIQQEPDGIGGGLFQHTPEMPPNSVSIAVMVDDLQAYLDKAVGLGGSTLMPPTEIPGGFGAIAIFYDIAGNRISLFKSPEGHVSPND